jgi:phospholipase C
MESGGCVIAKCKRVLLRILAAMVLAAVPSTSLLAQQNPGNSSTKTPIKYVVVIFQENISFDHYFATYPNAANPPNEPVFHAKGDTPHVNNLLSAGLLTQNPNSTPPFRLDRTQAVTCDQNHAYSAEQKAFDGGLMDKFPEYVGYPQPTNPPKPAICPEYGHGSGIVMGYYDGNTVTAFWNYAQHFAMSDNSFGSTFGPSTPGVLNLIAGNTSNATLVVGDAKGIIANAAPKGALIGDARPAGDDCNPPGSTVVTMSGKNVGDLLNSKNITWGWFQGGFRRTSLTPTGAAICGAASTGLPRSSSIDYIPHHEGFQYFQSTQNLNHVPPSDAKLIGQSADAANHQYDLEDFWTVVAEDKLPAVSFLKAKALQDGHAGYSDPLDEQNFVADAINRLERTPEWNDMAIIIAYDDSDGWYDHAMDPVVNQSNAADDFLSGPGACGKAPSGGNITAGRCGYGPRLPLLVISPHAKQNYVDHTLTDQSSVLRFIEDNWDLGRIGGDSFDAKAGTLDGMFDFKGKEKAPKLFLDPSTGETLP